MRLKDICQLNPAYLGENINDTVSFVPMESLRNGKIDLKEIAFSEGKGKYTYFADGDLLIAKVTPCFENGNIAVAENLKNGIGFGSSEIFVLRMNRETLNKYMFYLSQTSHFQYSACATMCGVGGLKRISPLFFKTYEFNIPSLDEQQRIVDYLDKKLAAIDHRVEVLEKEKDAYARLKKSVINQAVTRGLNPNVTLKDSGIDWIGFIPEHWELMRIKDVVSINKDSLGEDTDETYKFRYIDISNVSSEGEITLSDEMYFYDAPSRARRIVRKGDVIVSTVRTYLRAIAQIDFEAKDIIASTGFAVLSPKECMCSSYLAYVIRSSCIVDSICAQSTGVSYPAISSSKLSAIDMPLPSLSEQQAIADYLDEKCAKIDAAIENISKQIDASKRLKKAVINEAISGKINFDDN